MMSPIVLAFSSGIIPFNAYPVTFCVLDRTEVANCAASATKRQSLTNIIFAHYLKQRPLKECKDGSSEQ